MEQPVSVTIGRGPQSMAFFAFIFTAWFSLLIAVFNDHKRRPLDDARVRPLVKSLGFCALFLFVMKYAWFHNWLSNNLLPWLTKETYPPMTMAFFAFIFSVSFALFNAILNDYLLKRHWVRSVLRCGVFCGLFILVIKTSWAHHVLSSLLEWLRIENYPPMT